MASGYPFSFDLKTTPIKKGQKLSQIGHGSSDDRDPGRVSRSPLSKEPRSHMPVEPTPPSEQAACLKSTRSTAKSSPVVIHSEYFAPKSEEIGSNSANRHEQAEVEPAAQTPHVRFCEPVEGGEQPTKPNEDRMDDENVAFGRKQRDIGTYDAQTLETDFENLLQQLNQKRVEDQMAIAKFSKFLRNWVYIYFCLSSMDETIDNTLFSKHLDGTSHSQGGVFDQRTLPIGERAVATHRYGILLPTGRELSAGKRSQRAD